MFCSHVTDLPCGFNHYKEGFPKIQFEGEPEDVVENLVNSVHMTCLNWGKGLGSTGEYKEILRRLVCKIREETEADVILLTPNGDLPNPFMVNELHEEHTTAQRVNAIRELAEEEMVSLTDTYAVWEAAREKGCPWEELLANGINHPAAVGYDVYVKVLMKLFE